MLGDFGLAMSETEVIERFVGRSPEVMRDTIEAHLGHPLPDEWEEPYGGLRHQAYEAELRPVEGVREALDAISLPSCVASSSGHRGLRHKLELTGLYERFVGRIFSASEVSRRRHPSRRARETGDDGVRRQAPAAALLGLAAR